MCEKHHAVKRHVNIKNENKRKIKYMYIFVLPLYLFQTYVPTMYIYLFVPIDNSTTLFQTYVPTTIAPVLPNTSGLSGPLFSAGVKTGMFIISDVSSMYSISYSKQ